MNPELKLVIFEEKNILQELLNLLDQQYKLVLDRKIIELEKLTKCIEGKTKELATIEIKRRNIIEEKKFSLIIEQSDDSHIKTVYEEIKILLFKLEKQKDINDICIKQNLFYTNKMINVIRPTKSIGVYNSYGKVGK